MDTNTLTLVVVIGVLILLLWNYRPIMAYMGMTETFCGVASDKIPIWGPTMFDNAKYPELRPDEHYLYQMQLLSPQYGPPVIPMGAPAAAPVTGPVLVGPTSASTAQQTPLGAAIANNVAMDAYNSITGKQGMPPGTTTGSGASGAPVSGTPMLGAPGSVVMKETFGSMGCSKISMAIYLLIVAIIGVVIYQLGSATPATGTSGSMLSRFRGTTI